MLCPSGLLGTCHALASSKVRKQFFTHHCILTLKKCCSLQREGKKHLVSWMGEVSSRYGIHLFLWKTGGTLYKKGLTEQA